MEVIRPIQQSDQEAFVKLAQSASIGMTSMPKNPDLLAKKIEESLKAFSEGKESYLFVLENLQTKQVEGVAGLLSRTNVEYFFEIKEMPLPHFHPAVLKELKLLFPVTHQKGPSEICALFLAHTCRKTGLGRLLSLSRFLFLAAFPQRFDTTVTALMRGYFDLENRSPFWEGVGRKFLDVDFVTLLRLREEGEEFVKSILPQYPLYVPLLAQGAQSAIGHVHTHTLPAMKMLLHEGFLETKRIDFFDGGPQIAAATASIRTIRESRVGPVGAIVQQLQEGPDFLISNEQLNFRAVMSPLLVQEKITLSAQVAEALQVKEGDKIRYVCAR